MFDFFVMIKNFWQSIFALFNDHLIEIAGYKISYFSLVFAFLVIGFAVSYFWKGAKI